MYSDETKTDKIEVLEDGQIQMREVTRVYKDGVLISSSYHRRVLSPGDAVKDADPRVAGIASVVWTDAVIADFKTKAAINAQKLGEKL